MDKPNDHDIAYDAVDAWYTSGEVRATSSERRELVTTIEHLLTRARDEEQERVKRLVADATAKLPNTIAGRKARHHLICVFEELADRTPATPETP